jgi:hypothetical protein
LLLPPPCSHVAQICYGGGVDIMTAADISYATTDARLSVKEVGGVRESSPHSQTSPSSRIWGPSSAWVRSLAIASRASWR